MAFDKSLLKPCPVLHPTEQEFDNPIEYLSRLDILDLGTKNGLVKIVPPPGWKPPFSLAPSFTFHTRIQKLSDLGITTRSRRLFTNNLNRFFNMSGHRPVKRWFPYKGNHIYYYDLYLAVSKQFGDRGLDGISNTELRNLNATFGVDAGDHVLVREYNVHVRAYAEFLRSNGENYDFPESDPEDDLDSCLVCRKSHLRTLTLLCDNCNNPYHMKCLQPPLDEVPEGTWYCDRCLIGTGAYGFEENLEDKYNIWSFVEHCKQFESRFLDMFSVNRQPISLDQIEKIFWNFVGAENSELKVKYGADIHHLKPGEISGFPTADSPTSPYDPAAPTASYINHPWNLTRLPFSRGLLLNHINTSISGMTVPWIYVGSLLSTFCWHVEDHYTLSANYCHFGNIKKWYGIPSSHADAFESIMRESAPDLFQRQPDLLHQLVTLMSPSELAAKGIPCIYADQGPNEFVVTFPRVYHAGFNSGFNFNEAVNFTMDAWLPFGERAIRDYKEIKKENVFDHFQLVENIMTAYLGSAEFKHRRELIGQCIRTYELFLDNQSKIVGELESDRVDKIYADQAARSSLRAQSAESPQLVQSIGSPDSPKLVVSTSLQDTSTSMKRSKSENDDEDTLCDVCRTFISYQYCEVNNQHRRFGRWFRGRLKKESIITVNKLLTPIPSPQNAFKAENENVQLVADSDSALRLELLQEKRPIQDEYDELIRQAKKRAAEETTGKKRRHTSRLQKQGLPEMKDDEDVKDVNNNSSMKRVQYNSLLQQLNQFDVIKLCLKCTSQMCGEKGERIPRGSHLVFEKRFEDMQTILAQAKAKYMLGL